MYALRLYVYSLKAITFSNFVPHNFLTIRAIRWQTRTKEMNYKINRCQTQSETKTLQVKKKTKISKKWLTTYRFQANKE